MCNKAEELQNARTSVLMLCSREELEAKEKAIKISTAARNIYTSSGVCVTCSFARREALGSNQQRGSKQYSRSSILSSATFLVL